MRELSRCKFFTLADLGTKRKGGRKRESRVPRRVFKGKGMFFALFH